MKRILTLCALVAASFFIGGCDVSYLSGYLDDREFTPDADGLNVYFLDVGQADSAYITCGGESMMIDGGNKADSDYIVSFLDDIGENDLKYVFGTHVHEDHIGGLAGALTQCSVERAFCSKTSYDSKAFSDFKEKAEDQGVELEVPEPGDEYILGGCSITVLGPDEIGDDENNNSIVLKLEYGDTSFLFTGDAESSEEKQLLEDWGSKLRSDVLKVGHHGSETSSSYSFLREVMPEYAIISVGKGNSYGHPDENTLSRLSDAGASIYRTDENGTIKVHSDGYQISVECEK